MCLSHIAYRRQNGGALGDSRRALVISRWDLVETRWDLVKLVGC
jgi:hypothetical protein